ncbi:MAG: EamA family transporter [Phycisphaeraceae bacterium]|nr:EamA family transporter [Phycisphaeraceae bacterium]
MNTKGTGERHLPTLIASFICIYVVWGSTYLAIRLAVDTLPPFLMAGSRFLLGGLILYGLTRWRGAPRPTGRHWRSAVLIGTMLLFGGNGLVTWSEQWTPSGITALIIGSTPMWFVVLDWLLFSGTRPTPAKVAGLIVGFVGLTMLVGPRGLAEQGLPGWPALVILIASGIFACGSLLSRRVEQAPGLLQSAAMQMVCGGGVMAVIGLLAGEAHRVDFSRASASSLWAWVYLVVIGSLIAYSAFVYMLRHAAPATVSTYAYVNPIVAVFLGWLILDEPMSPRVVLAGALIVVAVAGITGYDAVAARWRRAKAESLKV